MRYLALCGAIFLTASVAMPAEACRAPMRLSNAVFDSPPLSASDGAVFRGRLVTDGSALAEARRAAPAVPQADQIDAIYLFALLERSDGPPIHIYKGEIQRHCDVSNYGVDHEVWIVGRPLPEQGGASFMMMALQGSGRWIDN
ncbi:MAG: hypothetical protein ACK4VY_10660 [Brevundimonas sp.]